MFEPVAQAGGLSGVILPFAQVRPVPLIPFSFNGIGNVTSSMCGTLKKVIVCENNSDHRQLQFARCHKWTCPVCFLQSVTRAADRSDDRLNAAISAYRGSGRRIKQLSHIVFSVPEKDYFYFEDQFPTVKAKCVTFAQQIGILGGSIIFHPYRILKHLDYQLKQYMREMDYEDRRGVWDLVRSDVLKLGSWEKYVYFSPHFHIVGFLPVVKERSDDFFKRTGWIYKNITARGQPLRSVFATNFYLLTHAAYIPGRQCITYFGCVSNNKLKVDRVKSTDFEKCSICGGSMYVHVCWDQDLAGNLTDLGHPSHEHVVNFYTVKYSLPKPKLKKSYK